MSPSPFARTRARIPATTNAAGLCLAIALDARFGDPPNGAHPVAWLGHLARLVEARFPHKLNSDPRRWSELSMSDPKQQRRHGLAATIAITTFAAATAAAIERPAPPASVRCTLTAAALIALTTSQRSLIQRVEQVAAALDADDLPAARKVAARHLVSGDTTDLDAGEVAGVALESLAENLSDGVVAPWFW